MSVFVSELGQKPGGLAWCTWALAASIAAAKASNLAVWAASSSSGAGGWAAWAKLSRLCKAEGLKTARSIKLQWLNTSLWPTLAKLKGQSMHKLHKCTQRSNFWTQIQPRTRIASHCHKLPNVGYLSIHKHFSARAPWSPSRASAAATASASRTAMAAARSAASATLSSVGSRAKPRSCAVYNTPWRPETSCDANIITAGQIVFPMTIKESYVSVSFVGKDICTLDTSSSISLNCQIHHSNYGILCPHYQKLLSDLHRFEDNLKRL